jgi:hypothetical protein
MDKHGQVSDKLSLFIKNKKKQKKTTYDHLFCQQKEKKMWSAKTQPCKPIHMAISFEEPDMLGHLGPNT